MEKLYIIKAEDAGNLTINLTFSDNTTQRVDIGDYIRRHPHPQYNKYLDPRKFSRFSIDNGNVVWGKNWDMIFQILAEFSLRKMRMTVGLLIRMPGSQRSSRSAGCEIWIA